MHSAANIGGLLGSARQYTTNQLSGLYWSQETAHLYAQQMQAQGFREVYDISTDSMKRVYTTFRAQLRAEIDAWLPRIRN